MMIKISRLELKLKQYVKQVARIADQKNIPAYLVGGTVRDLIMGKKNMDLDFVFEADAITLAKALVRQVKGKMILYPRFKTASILLNSGNIIDLVTARREKYPKPGVLPVVKPGTLKDDLHRRDFTINAMAICINKSGFGELIDNHNGQKDLKSKKIRALHSKSFIDDPTRILRAIRYEQRYNFQLERATLKWLKHSVALQSFQTISADRFFRDFKKILNENNPVPIIQRLSVLKVLKGINPSLKVNFRLLKAIDRNIAVAKKLKQINLEQIWFLYLLSMLEPLTDRAREQFAQHYSLTRAQKKTILQFGQLSDIMRILLRTKISLSIVNQQLKPLTPLSAAYLKVRTNNRQIHRNLAILNI